MLRKSCHAKKGIKTSNFVCVGPSLACSAKMFSPAAKKLRLSEEPVDVAMPFVKEPGFTLDNLPPHHFHLGEDLFANVLIFAGSVRVHLRQFINGDNGLWTPSKNGVALPPFLWQALSHASKNLVNFVNLPSTPNEFSVVRNSLFLSTTYSEKELSTVITLQRFFKRHDFTRVFAPGVCVFNEQQWKRLKAVSQRLTDSVISLCFGPLLRSHVAAEVMKCPLQDTDLCPDIAQELLSTSLAEILSGALTLHINQLFECVGCQNHYANQLGHECMTFDLDTRLGLYEHLALCKVSVRDLASDFVRRNSLLTKFITSDFMNSVIPANLIQTAKSLYLSDDTWKM